MTMRTITISDKDGKPITRRGKDVSWMSVPLSEGTSIHIELGCKKGVLIEVLGKGNCKIHLPPKAVMIPAGDRILEVRYR